MMKDLRKLLVRTLGFETYIRLVSRVYLRLVGNQPREFLPKQGFGGCHIAGGLL